jgi:hypothetical protein
MLPDRDGRETRHSGQWRGCSGHEIPDASVVPKLFADFAAQGEISNIQISDQVTTPVIRQIIKRG